MATGYVIDLAENKQNNELDKKDTKYIWWKFGIGEIKLKIIVIDNKHRLFTIDKIGI